MSRVAAPSVAGKLWKGAAGILGVRCLTERPLRKARNRPDVKKIRISVPFWTTCWLPIYVAADKGFFTGEVLDAEIQTTSQVYKDLRRGGAMDRTAEQILSGETDFMVVVTTAYRLVSNGADLRILCGVYTQPAHRIVARPEIKGISDLRGRRLMVKSRLASSYFEAWFLLTRFGLDPNRDLTIVEAGSPGLEERMQEALLKGEVDAITAASPYPFIAERRGFRIIGYMGDYVNYPNDALITTGRMVREQAETVQKAVNAVVRAEDFIQSNRKDAMDVALKHVRLLEQEAAARDYDVVHKAWAAQISLDDLKNGIELFAGLHGLPYVHPEKFVDFSFLEASRTRN